CRKELICQRECSALAGAAEYAFKNELLRNVAYEGLLKKSRRGHHARLAAWLIHRSGERINEFTGLVAAHFEQAGCETEAAQWYGRAGLQANAGYAPAAAIEYLRKALALSASTASRASSSFDAKTLGGTVPSPSSSAGEWRQGLGDALVAQA